MGFFSKYISDSEPLAPAQDFKSKTTGGIFMGPASSLSEAPLGTCDMLDRPGASGGVMRFLRGPQGDLRPLLVPGSPSRFPIYQKGFGNQGLETAQIPWPSSQAGIPFPPKTGSGDPWWLCGPH